jgi:hypothetical protein
MAVMVKKRFSKPILVDITAFFSLLLKKKVSQEDGGRRIAYCCV